MIDFEQIARGRFAIRPYPWTEIGNLYLIEDAAVLAATYPLDHYKTVDGADGEKTYVYQARNFVPMGENRLSFAEALSPAWRRFGEELLSPAYRRAMSELTGYDLACMPMETNFYHYNPAAHQGPHVDLPAKLVVHIFYFNAAWDVRDGGCLAVLNSKNPADVVHLVPPIVGSSAVFIRSDHSWHQVQKVNPGVRESRRALVVTFYKPGSPSTLWPAHEAPVLGDYIPVGAA